MTFLKKILNFKKKKEERRCSQCGGTGIYKDESYPSGTNCFNFLIGLIFFISLLESLCGEDLTQLISFIVFLICVFIVTVICLEYNQQKEKETKE